MSTDNSAAAFDMSAAWCLHPQVAVRRERFGALLYHFGTRRLSFVKTPQLLRVLQLLATEASASAACAAAGIGEAEVTAYRRALATLASSSMIRERSQA